MTRRYNQLVILITTECNLECPRCCYRMGFNESPRRHFTVAEVLQHAGLFRGLEVIYISGGEPTMHPNLMGMIKGVRKQMAPKRICLATNGLTVMEHIKEAQMVDWVMVSQVKGGGARARALKNAAKLPLVTVEPTPHVEIPLEKERPGALPCKRIDVPMYVDGRLYPCCVAYGIPSSHWIEPTENWHAELRNLPLPCSWCGFSKRRK